MGVPAPERHDKGIALLPVEFLIADPSRARAAKSMVHDRVRVTMRAAFLAGPDHLRAHEQRMGRAQFQFRVLVTDKSTERFFGTDKLCGSIERRANLLPLPKKRPEARLRLAKTGAGIGNRPVADEILLFEFLIELFQR